MVPVLNQIGTDVACVGVCLLFLSLISGYDLILN